MNHQTNTDSNDWLDKLAENIWSMNTYVLDEPEMAEFKQAIQSKVDEMVREARLDEIESLNQIQIHQPMQLGTEIIARLLQLSTNKKGEE